MNTTDFSEVNVRGRETKSNQSKSLNLNFSQEKKSWGGKKICAALYANQLCHRIRIKQTKPVAVPSVPHPSSFQEVLHIENIEFVKAGTSPGSDTTLVPSQGTLLPPATPQPFCSLESPQLTLLQTPSQPGARASHPKYRKKQHGTNSLIAMETAKHQAQAEGRAFLFAVPVWHTACSPAQLEPGSSSALLMLPAPDSSYGIEAQQGTGIFQRNLSQNAFCGCLWQMLFVICLFPKVIILP